jgi:hypothetical protein
MRTSWFTFGQGQAHHVAGVTFDPNVAVEITADDPRAEMIRLFGRKWGAEYDERPEDRFIPGGVLVLNSSGGFDRG